MLVVASFILLILLLFLILKSNFLPGNIMALLSIATALIIGNGFSGTMGLAHSGMQAVAAVVMVFIFATIYFGVMSDAGLFEPIILRLMRIKWVGKSVFSVVAVASLIAMVAHLDGQGITTLIVTVPPMLIVFDKLKIPRTIMGMIFSTVVGAMNIIPWGGPVVRAAVVINMDVMDLYLRMLPVQIAGLILSFVALYFVSKKEEKRGEFQPSEDASFALGEVSEEVKALRRPGLFWVNLALTIILMAAMFTGIPAHIGFLIGCGIALPLNYRTIKEQEQRIKAHAGNLLVNCYTIIGAGVLLGIMQGTDMFYAIANAAVAIVPPALNYVMHIILGLLSVPLSFVLNTDAMIYGILPVAVSVGGQFGVAPVTIAAMVISARVMITGLSLTTPSVYLGLGLMKISFKDAFKLAWKWMVALAVIMVLLSAVVVR